MLFFIKTFGIFKKKSYLCGLKYAVNFTIMKTNWKKSIVLTILLSFVLMPNAWAESFVIDNLLEYTLLNKDTTIDGNTYPTVEVGQAYTSTNGFSKPTGLLTIPETVEYEDVTYRVTAIENHTDNKSKPGGFYGCPHITSISFPEGLQRIGYKAFAGCKNSSFVLVDGSNFRGQIADSEIFIDGRVIKIDSFFISKHEVTQEEYAEIMGENPSSIKGENHPVESVSWYDAIYFCNKLSTMFGLVPVYSYRGITDVTKWDYVPHESKYMLEVEQNLNANGYRLPTREEWQYAAKGGKDFNYAGSSNIDEVAWYRYNSDDKTHEVGKKKVNGYGLFDMTGNVWEWCWNSANDYLRYYCGGSWSDRDNFIQVWQEYSDYADEQYDNIGFRIVCNAE